jgi:THO complex subunit 4
MKYDRAGRSEGTAFVTYESDRDAKEAIIEYNNANAAGQPIRLTLMPSGPRRNPLENATPPVRSLAERITVPSGRSRSLSPRRNDGDGGRKGVDRYRPGGHSSRSRSPLPNRRREAGRRPGVRREQPGGGRRGGGDRQEKGERGGRDGRPKKTQEELDAEMEDYFNSGNGQATDSAPAINSNGIGASEPQGEDIDMIE